MYKANLFPHIYVWTGIWQGMGWSSVIYFAALSGIDPQLLEAATLDGASRVQKIIHVKLPSVMPIMIIQLILNAGSLLNVGYEKVYLLQNSLNLDTSEVISTYVYKRGLVDAQYSFSTAEPSFSAKPLTVSAGALKFSYHALSLLSAESSSALQRLPLL